MKFHKKIKSIREKSANFGAVGFFLALAALTAGCESEIEKNIRESRERGAANVRHFAEKAKKGNQEMQGKKCAAAGDCKKQ